MKAFTEKALLAAKNNTGADDSVAPLTTNVVQKSDPVALKRVMKEYFCVVANGAPMADLAEEEIALGVRADTAYRDLLRLGLNKVSSQAPITALRQVMNICAVKSEAFPGFLAAIDKFCDVSKVTGEAEKARKAKLTPAELEKEEAAAKAKRAAAAMAFKRDTGAYKGAFGDIAHTPNASGELPENAHRNPFRKMAFPMYQPTGDRETPVATYDYFEREVFAVPRDLSITTTERVVLAIITAITNHLHNPKGPTRYVRTGRDGSTYNDERNPVSGPQDHHAQVRVTVEVAKPVFTIGTLTLRETDKPLPASACAVDKLNMATHYSANLLDRCTKISRKETKIAVKRTIEPSGDFWRRVKLFRGNELRLAKLIETADKEKADGDFVNTLDAAMLTELGGKRT